MYFVEHKLLTLPQYLSLPPVFGGVRVARSLVFCVGFINWLIVKHQVCDISSIVMIRTSLKITNRADKRWSLNGSRSECFRSIYCIVKTNGSDTICIQLNIVFSKMRIMLNRKQPTCRKSLYHIISCRVNIAVSCIIYMNLYKCAIILFIQGTDNGI
jgi:hypothetical protein